MPPRAASAIAIRLLRRVETGPGVPVSVRSCRPDGAGRDEADLEVGPGPEAPPSDPRGGIQAKTDSLGGLGRRASRSGPRVGASAGVVAKPPPRIWAGRS